MTTQPDGHRPRRRWRVGTPLVFALAGALFAVSAANSEGIPLRPGGTTDLAGLVRAESANAEELQQEVARLTEEVETLSRAVDDEVVAEARAAAGRLRDPAGFEEVNGRGLTVTLQDAPAELRDDAEVDLNLLVVHQQDIQAVVNAMWRAGARAITIKGQRIISTTGIKCIGNTVELHGIPYSQPYDITAVGDPEALEEAIDRDSYLSVYRAQAENSEIAIGWEMEREGQVTAPEYVGPGRLDYAEPVS